MSVFSQQCKTKYNTHKSLLSEIAEKIKLVNTGNPLDDIYYFQCKVCNSGKISLSNVDVVAAKNV